MVLAMPPMSAVASTVEPLSETEIRYAALDGETNFLAISEDTEWFDFREELPEDPQVPRAQITPIEPHASASHRTDVYLAKCRSSIFGKSGGTRDRRSLGTGTIA